VALKSGGDFKAPIMLDRGRPRQRSPRSGLCSCEFESGWKKRIHNNGGGDHEGF